jgi:hypothetical protein
MALKPLQTNIKIDDIKNTKPIEKRASLANPKSLENNGINSKINNQKKEIPDKKEQNKENLPKEEKKEENDNRFKKYEIEGDEIDKELKEGHNLFVEALNILMDNIDSEEKNNESEIKSIKTEINRCYRINKRN